MFEWKESKSTLRIIFHKILPKISPNKLHSNVWGGCWPRICSHFGLLIYLCDLFLGKIANICDGEEIALQFEGMDVTAYDVMSIELVEWVHTTVNRC